jgi:CheY-like chemotaxis protein
MGNPVTIVDDLDEQGRLTEVYGRLRLKLLDLSKKNRMLNYNVVNQQVVLGILGSLGYSADVVANGLEAVEAAGRIPYSAILMDCRMPEMDGYTAAATIWQSRSQSRHIPIIALTADVVSDARAKALAAGMNDYITKPIKADELASALERWVPAPAQIDLQNVSIQPSLDDEVFESLKGLESCAPGLSRKVMDAFWEDTPRRLEDIEQALLGHNAEKLHAFRTR